MFLINERASNETAADAKWSFAKRVLILHVSFRSLLNSKFTSQRKEKRKFSLTSYSILMRNSLYFNAEADT